MSQFLSKEKRQLLAQVLQSRESRQLLSQASARPRARRVMIGPRSDPAAPSPLSFAQQRFWLLHQLDPAKGHCNLSVAFRLTGELNEGALARTLRNLVRRHESLRTMFPLLNGEIVQVVRAPGKPDFFQRDLSALNDGQREDAAQAILHEEAIKPFDIATEPCARFRLLRLSETTYWLLLIAHHIVFDTWSLGVFIREVGAGYEAACHDRPFPLSDLEAQYADFACWEQRAAAEGRFIEHLSYWEGKLRGAPELLTLPLDRPRAPFDGARGRCEVFGWGRSVAESVAALGNGERASVFMILLATLSVLLHRYGCGRDITVGSAFGNRPSHDAEAMIGCFMNTLIFRTRISGDPSFRQLLRQVRDDSLITYEHSEAPFQQVVAALNPKRHPSYSPYSQVMLIVQNAELPSLVGPGIELARMPVWDRFLPQQDLTFHVRAFEGSLRGTLDYNSDIFEYSTALRLLRHFEQLLASAVQEPDRPISRLSFLSPSELLQLTIEGGDEVSGKTPEPDLVHLDFERHAARTPDKIAFVDGDKQLTYSELNRRSNALAWRLRDLNAGPELQVAVCLTSPAARLIGMLAVLKAGAAYMPLDPSMPRTRLRAVLRGAGLAVLVTESRVAAALDRHDCLTICLYEERVEPGRTSNPPVQLHQDNLACVLNTSGAEGMPKPVMLTHRALASAVHTLGSTISFEGGDALAVLATPPSDRQYVEQLVALTVGTRVAVFAGGEAEDGHLLKRAVEEAAVNVMQATPHTWRRLLDSGWSSPPGFKLLCWGETLPPDLADDLLADDVLLWNLYGPAETAFLASASQLGQGEPVTIGTPLASAHAYVLDESLHPAPAGVAGKFYLSGALLARGYLNRPGLTAERFLPNPLARDSGSRLYSTGDVASFSPAGQLSFMYRSEPQTMIQGFQVRIGAIEYALCRHTAVRHALVLLREKSVIAYVVPRRTRATERELSLDAFREFLRMQLPDHMMPSAVYVVDALPQGLCGKTSRRAPLGTEGAVVASEAPQYRAPESETERVVARVWARVLELERVGLDEDFFALGGDSLKAQRALVEVEKQLGTSVVTAGAAFANPTVAQLSEHIDRAKRIGPKRKSWLRASSKVGSDAIWIEHLLGVRRPGAALASIERDQ